MTFVELLQNFQAVFSTWFPYFLRIGTFLTPILIMIDLSVTLMRMLKGTAEIITLAQKVVVWGVTIWMIRSPASTFATIIYSFEYYGLQLGGLTAINPDQAADVGIVVMSKGLLRLENLGMITPFSPESWALVLLLTAISIIWFLLAVKISFVYVQLYLLLCVGPFFVPWAGTKATASITDGYFSMMFSVGVEFMLTAGLMGATINLGAQSIGAFLVGTEPVGDLLQLGAASLLLLLVVLKISSLSKYQINLFQTLHAV